MHRQFNDLTIKFVDYLDKNIFFEKEIREFKIEFARNQSINTLKPVKFFMKDMILFGENILLRDDLFVFKSTLSLRLGILKNWERLNKATKSIIWEYIQGIYILGMHSLGKDDELKQIIAKSGYKISS
jgi:hypothetical protein